MKAIQEATEGGGEEVRLQDQRDDEGCAGCAAGGGEEVRLQDQGDDEGCAGPAAGGDIRSRSSRSQGRSGQAHGRGQPAAARSDQGEGAGGSAMPEPAMQHRPAALTRRRSDQRDGSLGGGPSPTLAGAKAVSGAKPKAGNEMSNMRLAEFPPEAEQNDRDDVEYLEEAVGNLGRDHPEYALDRSHTRIAHGAPGLIVRRAVVVDSGSGNSIHDCPSRLR